MMMMKWASAPLVALALMAGACSSDGPEVSEPEDGTADNTVAVTADPATDPAAEAQGVVDALSASYAKQDPTLLAPVLADAVTFSDPTFGDEFTGADAYQEFWAGWMGLPNWAYSPEFEITSDGTHVVDRGIWSGGSAEQGFAVPTLALHEVADGQIVSTTIYYADPDVPASVWAVIGPPPA